MNFLKRMIRRNPVLYNLALHILHIVRSRQFPGTEKYWENRYRSGGNSGAGSYNRLAEFKADVINTFITGKNIHTAVDFGCGDGNNLALMHFPKYIGLDVSPTAVKICMDKFKNDSSKSFYLYSSVAFADNHRLFASELSISSDVIYHLIEDGVYNNYMQHLFDAATKYVIIYSRLATHKFSYHEKGRDFLKWIRENQPAFKLVDTIENKYKFDPRDPHNTSDANFYFFERLA